MLDSDQLRVRGRRSGCMKHLQQLESESFFTKQGELRKCRHDELIVRRVGGLANSGRIACMVIT